MIRIGLLENVDDRLFGRAIDFGHEVVRALFVDLDAVEIEGGTIDDRGGATGSLHRRVQHGMHSVSDKMMSMSDAARSGVVAPTGGGPLQLRRCRARTLF